MRVTLEVFEKAKADFFEKILLIFNMLKTYWHYYLLHSIFSTLKHGEHRQKAKVKAELLTLMGSLRDENLIIPERFTQDFNCTGALETQAYNRLRNCFSGVPVQLKDKSDSDIIEFSFLKSTGAQ